MKIVVASVEGTSDRFQLFGLVASRPQARFPSAPPIRARKPGPFLRLIQTRACPQNYRTRPWEHYANPFLPGWHSPTGDDFRTVLARGAPSGRCEIDTKEVVNR